MKKIILIIAVTLFGFSAKAQFTPNNVIYWFGMNGTGQPVIDYTAWTTLLAPPTPHYAVSRPINSTAFTVSATKMSRVYYTVNISCTATIGGAATGKVELQYFDTGSSTWLPIADVSNSNTVTLAIALNSVIALDLELSGEVAANIQTRMVSTSSGTTTITYIRGTETY